MLYSKVVDNVNQVLTQYTYRLTVRQIYYRLVSPPFQTFGNTATNYKTFDKILTRARERGEVDWRRIEDRARGLLGGEGTTWDTAEEYMDWLKDTFNADYFQASYWANQPVYVEVWVEKDALATLFTEASKDWKVNVFPSRGYSSLTKIMEALGRFPDDKPTRILHFTDHDPSGLNMAKDLQERLESYGATDFMVDRRALTIDQVREFDLAPNPTKSTDSRSPAYVAEYGNECWELDALPPDELTRIIRESIESVVDTDAWHNSQTDEAETKESIVAALDGHKQDFADLVERIKRTLADSS